MEWKVQRLPDLAGYTVEWAEANNFLLARRDRIYRSRDLTPPFTEVARIGASVLRRATSKFRLGQRLLRYMVYNLVPLKNGDLFVTFGKSVGIISNGVYADLPGLARACRVLRRGCAVDSNGNVYFGEYLSNNDRGRVNIYRYRTGGKRLEVAYTFAEKTIRHVHGMYFDEYSNSIYCLTGDVERECRILRSQDGFKSFDVVGEGDESWRAVSLLFDRRYIHYGTDAEFEDNRIIRLDRDSLEREDVGDVTGTVFYSARVGEDLFFTTTAENAPSQKQNVAAIWNITPQGKICKIAEFEKDRWHGGLFMFGTVHLPYKNGFDDRLFFALVGVTGDDQTFCLRRDQGP